MGKFILGVLIGGIGGMYVAASTLNAMEQRKIGASSVMLKRARSGSFIQGLRAANAVWNELNDNSSFIDELEDESIRVGENQI